MVRQSYINNALLCNTLCVACSNMINDKSAITCYTCWNLHKLTQTKKSTKCMVALTSLAIDLFF